ncbi:hypothetical protein C8T65DRAFT_729542 [Cerioporus squamosus]|nr:hypothetical protein C8T65DRAFT_729542 [Cerioporus squamosus]
MYKSLIPHRHRLKLQTYTALSPPFWHHQNPSRTSPSSAMSDALPVLPDRPTPVTQSIFQQTYGGSLACCQVMLVFYGLSVLQSYLYFIRYERDRIYLKLLVLVLFCLSTTHAMFVCHTVWHYRLQLHQRGTTYRRRMVRQVATRCVRSISETDRLYFRARSVYAATAIGVVTCFLVQCFFARMIFTLTKGKWQMIIGVTMSLLIMAQLGFGIELSVKLFQIWDLFLLKETVYVAMIPLFCVRMASDAVTASTLCVVLYDATTADFRSSVKLVKTLILYAINRFVLTTVLVVIQTIYLIIRPGEIWAMVLEFITVHIYVNSLLATLNARDHLRELGKNPTTGTDSRSPGGRLTPMAFRPGWRGRFNDTLDSEPSGITVSEQVHVDFVPLDHSGIVPQSFELKELDSKASVTPERFV